MLTQVGEWTPSTLLSLASRMLTRALPFNLVVTNVPGPQMPLYLLGARMLDNYGLMPLIDNLCLGIALFSYDGQLCWGFTCDWDLLPDLHDFVLDVDAAFEELQAAAAAAGRAAADASTRAPPRLKRAPRKVHKEPRGVPAQAEAVAGLDDHALHHGAARSPSLTGAVPHLGALAEGLPLCIEPAGDDDVGRLCAWLREQRRMGAGSPDRSTARSCSAASVFDAPDLRARRRARSTTT